MSQHPEPTRPLTAPASAGSPDSAIPALSAIEAALNELAAPGSPAFAVPGIRAFDTRRLAAALALGTLLHPPVRLVIENTAVQPSAPTFPVGGKNSTTGRANRQSRAASGTTPGPSVSPPVTRPRKHGTSALNKRLGCPKDTPAPPRRFHGPRTPDLDRALSRAKRCTACRRLLADHATGSEAGPRSPVSDPRTPDTARPRSPRPSPTVSVRPRSPAPVLAPEPKPRVRSPVPRFPSPAPSLTPSDSVSQAPSRPRTPTSTAVSRARRDPWECPALSGCTATVTDPVTDVDTPIPASTDLRDYTLRQGFLGTVPRTCTLCRGIIAPAPPPPQRVDTRQGTDARGRPVTTTTTWSMPSAPQVPYGIITPVDGNLRIRPELPVHIDCATANTWLHRPE